MRRFFRNLFLALLIGAASLSFAPHAFSQSAKAKDPQAIFGILENPRGAIRIVPTRNIPLEEGVVYGWMVKTPAESGTGELVEEFTLPVAPKTWGDEMPPVRREITNKGRTLITTRQIDFRDGLYSNFWTVAEGDPAGEYRIVVRLNGKIIGKFSFALKAPAI